MCGLNLLFAPSLSWANLTFFFGNNPQPGEENVLLNTGTTGNTMLGTPNQSGLLVNFTSSQVLTELSNGQARIEASICKTRFCRREATAPAD